MGDHPIEALMKTTMDNLKDMIDVNTIVGDPVETPDGTVIIPISRVSFGFASGGGEYQSKNKNVSTQDDSDIDQKLPFGGGTGAGVSVQPVAFMVVGNAQMKLLPIDQNATIIDNLMNLAPQLLDKIQVMCEKKKDSRIKKNINENEKE